MTENKTALAERKKVSLAATIAERMSIEPHTLLDMMKSQIITIPDYGNHAYPVKNEELMWVMSVMKELDLTPVVREIHAWRGYDGKLVIHVGYDGWVKCARRNSRYSHVSYECGPTVEAPDGRGQPCPEWISPTVHFSDGSPPASFPPVYLREWYVRSRGKKNKPGEFHDGPWQNHTSNRLRQKAFTIAVREVFGFAVLDDVDREWVELTDEPINERVERETNQTVNTEADRLAAKMADIKAGQQPQAQQEAEDGEFDAVAPWEKEIGETDPPDGTEAAEQQPGAGSSGDTPPPEAGLHGACYAPGCRNDAVGECSCGVAFCPQHSAGGDTCASCGSTGLF